jgi:hypothetical protein
VWGKGVVRTKNPIITARVPAAMQNVFKNYLLCYRSTGYYYTFYPSQAAGSNIVYNQLYMTAGYIYFRVSDGAFMGSDFTDLDCNSMSMADLVATGRAID